MVVGEMESGGALQLLETMLLMGLLALRAMFIPTGFWLTRINMLLHGRSRCGEIPCLASCPILCPHLPRQ